MIKNKFKRSPKSLILSINKKEWSLIAAGGSECVQGIYRYFPCTKNIGKNIEKIMKCGRDDVKDDKLLQNISLEVAYVHLERLTNDTKRDRR